MTQNNNHVKIIVAVISLVGVLSTALLSNWDKFFRSSDNGRGNTPSQSTAGTASPNIGSIQGNVTISVNENTQTLDVPDFSKQDLTINDIDLLEQFIEKHRSKLVHINVTIPERQSEISQENTKTFTLASALCQTKNFMNCATCYLMLSGGDYELGWYKGNNILTGYFIIGENVEYHSGPYYKLKGVPREQVLLLTQKSSVK